MTDERDTESTATVLLAGGANLAIAVAKTAGGLLSGSAAMLAEAAHSVADTFNQVLLLTALRRSRRPPDARHPFGYGQERYFWSLLAGGDIEHYADEIDERVRARFPEVRHLFIDPTNAARERPDGEESASSDDQEEPRR